MMCTQQLRSIGKQSLLAISLSFFAATYVQANDVVSVEKEIIKEATFVTMNAVEGKEKELADFLVVGAGLVAETEPMTLVWAGLRNENGMMIFDAFADNSGRDAHFAGQVAAALKENAPALVSGGWDDGVLANVKNPKVLSGRTSGNASEMKIALFVPITAKAGQEKALAEFLTSAAALVEETEPKTAFWYALQVSENEFVITDFFADQSGVDAHFAGKVAAALKENAPQLIVGGWDEGVAANVQRFDVLVMTGK